MLNDSYFPNAVVNILLNVSLLVIPCMWILIAGTLAKRYTWCSQSAITLVAVTLIVVSVIATVIFFLAGAVNPYIQPSKIDPKWPISNVKGQPYCEYSVYGTMRADDAQISGLR